MATQKIPLYIPTFINSATYAPARVLPRIYFYNGQVECEYWWVTSENNAANRQDKFPYFDHYNVVSGSFPTSDSKSLLFNNEAASYGEMPTGSLYSTYWEKYVSFLYDPRTRVLNCSAIIPFADYTKITLNDIVNFRGNYWHLRAINDYSLKTGECNLQLVGPIISDTFNQLAPEPPAPSTPNSASITWLNITDSDAPSSFRIYDNGSNRVTSTTTTGGNFFVTQSHIVNAEIDITSFPSSGSVTMSLYVNGDATIFSTTNANTTLTASFTAVGGNSYSITGSVEWNNSAATYEWYQLTSCVDSSVIYSTAYSTGTFNTGSIVSNTSYGTYYQITNKYSSDPGGSQINIVSSGYSTCPDENCYNYTYRAFASCTIYYYNCSGVQQSQFVNNGQTVNLTCIKSYGQSGCGTWTQGTPC